MKRNQKGWLLLAGIWLSRCGLIQGMTVDEPVASKPSTKAQWDADQSDDLRLKSEARDAQCAFERAKKHAGAAYNLCEDEALERRPLYSSNAVDCFSGLYRLGKVRRPGSPELKGAHTLAEREKHESDIASDPQWRMYDLGKLTIDTSDGRMTLAAMMERCRSLLTDDERRRAPKANL